jgi:prepilin-type N-terminal cleavage/methylation domain-containing protein
MKNNFQFSIFLPTMLRKALQAGNFQKSGFTLVETMIAVAILALAVAGPLYTASRAIVAAETARDQLVASYLAQEGIEYVRAMRDNEFLSAYQAGGANVSTTAWNNFLNGADASSVTRCRAPAVCTLDPAGGGTLAACPSGACTPLYLAPTNVYTQTSGGTVTPFTRTVQAVDVTASDEKIVSRVSWSFHGLPYAVTVTDHLTPWQ